MPSKLSGKERYKLAKEKKKVFTSMTIQPGCLYYDISDGTPIGNRAYRAPDDGLTVTNLEPVNPPWYGMNQIGSAGDRRIAFDVEMTREYYYER